LSSTTRVCRDGVFLILEAQRHSAI
jgi:hypothetical protein